MGKDSTGRPLLEVPLVPVSRLALGVQVVQLVRRVPVVQVVLAVLCFRAGPVDRWVPSVLLGLVVPSVPVLPCCLRFLAVLGVPCRLGFLADRWGLGVLGFLGCLGFLGRRGFLEFLGYLCRPGFLVDLYRQQVLVVLVDSTCSRPWSRKRVACFQANLGRQVLLPNRGCRPVLRRRARRLVLVGKCSCRCIDSFQPGGLPSVVEQSWTMTFCGCGHFPKAIGILPYRDGAVH